MWKLKLSSIKQFFAIVIFIIINIHITIIILKWYDKTHLHSHGKDIKLINSKKSINSNFGSYISNKIEQIVQVEESLINTIEDKISHITTAEYLNFHNNHNEIEEVNLPTILNKNESNSYILNDNIEHISTLPSISVDESEYFYGSIIEREFDSWNLHITTFLMNHYMLDPSVTTGPYRVHPSMKDTWLRASVKFESAHYRSNGQRVLPNHMFCRISNTKTSKSYVVPGVFMPNRLTSDSNSNRRLDIFRCLLQDSKRAHLELIHTNCAVHVEILREVLFSEDHSVDLNIPEDQRYLSLIKFTVPWITRREGYILSETSKSSNLNAWKGFDYKAAILAEGQEHLNSNYIQKSNNGDSFHLCVGGIAKIPTKKILPYILEFISHHLLIGVDHIYLPIALDWKNPSMIKILEILKSYIDEGKLSVISQVNEVDSVFSVGGLVWLRNSIKVFTNNFYLYLAKGQADYLLLLDIDEFFIPKRSFKSIMDVIRSIEPGYGQSLKHKKLSTKTEILKEQRDTWKGGRGWADGEAHPFCYININSELFAHKLDKDRKTSNPFIGEFITHGPEDRTDKRLHRFAYDKAILPTRVIYQSGLACGGGCKLEEEFTSCGNNSDVILEYSNKNKNFNLNNFCGFYNDDTLPKSINFDKNGKSIEFRNHHDFNHIITNNDIKKLNPDEEASIYHFLVWRQEFASESTLKNDNYYSNRYFINVKNDIIKRGLDKYISLISNKGERSNIDSESQQWPKLHSNSDFKSKQEETRNSIINKAYSYSTSSTDASPGVQGPKFNYSNREYEDIVLLPNFSIDYSEYVLAGMIERVSDSYDLYLTTFFMNAFLLEGGKVGASALGALKVQPNVIKTWQKAMRKMEKIKYLDNGQRFNSPKFICKIKHSEKSEIYIVEGQWVPSRSTPDSNSNRRLDIFRCLMQHTEKAYMELARSDQYLTVEISSGEDHIIKYKIPWSSRMTGIMLDLPSHKLNQASLHDHWKGFNKTQPGVWTHDDIYMCVPGLESPPSKTLLPALIEFIEHHIQLGVSHIFITALFNWNSIHMDSFLRLFDSYIKEGKLSFSSSASDGIDLAYSTGGIQFARDNFKIFHVNMCSYFAKGVADYVGIWDFDEFFIPKGKYKTIMDVVRGQESPIPITSLHNAKDKVIAIHNKWKSGRGLADGDGHPFCYLLLKSQVTLTDEKYVNINLVDNPWLGQRYLHGMEKIGHGLGFYKTIRPTRVIFQGGLHLPGGCKLPYPFSGCDKGVEFCYDDIGSPYRLTKYNGTAIIFNKDQMFSEVVTKRDGKLINPDDGGVINHVQLNRVWHRPSQFALNHKSVYANDYFPNVLNKINQRDIALYISLPERSQKPFPEPDDKWKDIQKITNASNYNPPTSFSWSKKYRLSKMKEKKFETILPHMASDASDYVLSSIIERESDSFDLYLTTFFLSHCMLEFDVTGNSAHKVTTKAIPMWTEAITKFKEVKYSSSGQRSPKIKYYCIIKNSENDVEYKVEGMFMPNKLTPDINANKRTDILRCKITESESAYLNLITSKENLYVEIYREDISLIDFKIPWLSRVQSTFLTTSDVSSSFNAWKGYNKLKHGKFTQDVIYLCIPGIESPASKKHLTIFIEFIQYHLLIGVSHIFLTAFFSWESIQMKYYLQILKSFIDSGEVTISSHSSTDNVDFIYSMDGLSWNRDTAKIFQVNMCTYFAKGVADYVGIWDIDEFFIPKGEFNSIVDVIKSVESKDKLIPFPDSTDLNNLFKEWEPNQKHDYERKHGFANHDAHPFCYIQVLSEVVANKEPTSVVDFNHLWIGERFDHSPEPSDRHGKPTSRVSKQFSFKKQIIPTRTMFQIGLHMSGACKLPPVWDGCKDSKDGFCFNDNPDNLSFRQMLPNEKVTYTGARFTDIQTSHKFDDIVYNGDTRRLSLHNEGSLYHFMHFRFYHSTVNPEVLLEKNKYASIYFNKTLELLRKRKIDLYITLPESSEPWPIETDKWIDFDVVYNNREILSPLLDSSLKVQFKNKFNPNKNHQYRRHN
jgi:hypothetical protein